ncbi:methyltransferase domain-containing protein [Actinophytocola sediminis]
MTTDSEPTGPDAAKQFYDIADLILSTIWGANFHSGYWTSEEDDSANDVAARRLNDLLIDKLGVTEGHRVLDVGSGLGEPAFQLARTTGAQVLGVTVAQPQVDEANRRAAALGLADTVSFVNADGLALPDADGSFDAAWAIESFIHMDRAGALKEIARVLRPGGRVVVTDLVQPDLPVTDTDETRSEMQESMALTAFPTVAEYRRLIEDSGLVVTEILDITRQTKRTHARMAEAARAHYDQLVADQGPAAAEILDMMMTSIDVGYIVAVGTLPG